MWPFQIEIFFENAKLTFSFSFFFFARNLWNEFVRIIKEIKEFRKLRARICIEVISKISTRSEQYEVKRNGGIGIEIFYVFSHSEQNTACT